jgi:hypothetical protein
VTRGAEAVFRTLAVVPGRGWALGLYRRLPGFAPASEWSYRQVARHRQGFSRLTRWVWGRHVVPPGETLTAWLFLRLLGIIFAIAFISLWVQIRGLVGDHGILPVRDYLDAARFQLGGSRFWDVPTLAWLNPGDGFLVGLCAAGTALAACLAAGLLPWVALLGCWILYLSLAVAGQNFLWFQWDGLLIETGFLALFLAPHRLRSRPRSDPAPPRVGLWLLRWLLFRLMLSSAAVKLTSGDPTWRSLNALRYHYETQPLPPWTAWYAHHLPVWFQHVSVMILFAIEGVLPFFIAAPRRIRFAAAGGMAFLQVLILVTGNYGFFNLLTLALCVLLLDDGVWPQWLRRTAGMDVIGERRRPGGRLRAIAAWALVAVSLVPLARAIEPRGNPLAPLVPVYRLISPWRIVNPYGLFAVMTTERPEIVVEGSDDGSTWLPYRFRWKVGDVDRRPPFVAPHMPRLDWQMWFAALSDFRSQGWYLAFCRRLLEGSPEVIRLLDRDPFPGRPPRYLRGTVYDYRFTDAATRRATGAWWTREERGPYTPVLTLEGGKLRAVREGGS